MRCARLALDPPQFGATYCLVDITVELLEPLAQIIDVPPEFMMQTLRRTWSRFCSATIISTRARSAYRASTGASISCGSAASACDEGGRRAAILVSASGRGSRRKRGGPFRRQTSHKFRRWSKGASPPARAVLSRVPQPKERC